MYLYLGTETVVLSNDVIGVFDIDAVTVSKKTRDFLKQAEQKKQVINVSYELPKSFVVCQKKQDTKVFISGINSSTIKKRTEKLFSE